MKTTIDINEWITDEEKKEIITDVFKERIENCLFKKNKGDLISDSEIQRILGNVSYNVIMNKLSEYIPDLENKLIEKVTKTISEKDISFYVFRENNSDYLEKESLATSIINETVKNNEKKIIENVEKAINGFNYKKKVAEKISCLFDSIADKMYSLSDLFERKADND